MNINKKRLNTTSAKLSIIILGLCFIILSGIFVGSEIIKPIYVVIISCLMIFGFYITVVPTTKAHRILLCATVFLLTSYPVARFELAHNLPIYLTDLLTLTLLVLVLFNKEGFDPEWKSSKLLPILLIFFWLPTSFFSFFYEVKITNNYYETFYMLLRTLLSLSMFFLIPVVVRDRDDLYWIVGCLVFGTLLTAILSISNSILPPEHAFIKLMDSLSPTNLAETSERYLSRNEPIRARALIGSPVPTGNVINLFLPLSYGLYLSGRFPRLKSWLLLIMLVCAFGVITTYSRGAILGLLLTVTILLITQPKGKQLYWGVIFFAFGVFFYVAEIKGWLEIDFVLKKFSQTFDDPTASYNDRARLEAYQNMPGFLLKHPEWLFVGRGFATFDLYSRGLLPGFIHSDTFNTQNHSLLITSFYQRGLVAMVILVLSYGYALNLLMSQIKMTGSATADLTSFRWLTISLLAAWVGQLPAWLFDHSFASIIHVQTTLFVFFGLVILAQRLYIHPSADHGIA